MMIIIITIIITIMIDATPAESHPKDQIRSNIILRLT